MEDSVRQRINNYLSMKEISNRELSRKIGMNETTLNNKLNGNRKIDVDLLCAILEQFKDLSAEWVLRGSGDVCVSEYTNTHSTPDESLEAQNKRLLETIDNLNYMLRQLIGKK